MATKGFSAHAARFDDDGRDGGLVDWSTTAFIEHEAWPAGEPGQRVRHVLGELRE
jgi:hypothetical protein